MYSDGKHYFCEDCGREISSEEYQENMGYCNVCYDWHEENADGHFNSDNWYFMGHFLFKE